MNDVGGARDPSIRVADLRVVRGGDEILPGLSLEVRPGEVTGLLGPSGSGKTTLMRAIMGVQVIRSGRIEVLGLPAGSRDLRRRVGYVTQAPAVYRDLTVEENLSYYAALLGVGRPEIESVVRTVGLGSLRKALAARLSGGELARLSLATALLNRPEVLVLDEPTVGLDPILRRELWQVFHELAAAGTTLLVSSHVMDEAGQCDRLLLLRGGRLLATGTPESLRAMTGTADLGEAFIRLIEREAPA